VRAGNDRRRRRLYAGANPMISKDEDPFFDVVPLDAVPWKEVLVLPLPERKPLAELVEQLGPFISQIWPMDVVKEGQADYSSARAYSDSAVQSIEIPVRTYSVGTAMAHESTIVVPEAHAQELDKVREARLRDASLVDRALPEDLVPMLLHLPDPTVVQIVVLRNDINPYDGWHGHEAGDPDFVSVASTSYGSRIEIFRRLADEDLWLEFLHEWAHLLHVSEPVHFRKFRHASKVEEGSAVSETVLRERAKVSPEEHWAVALGEALLNPLHLVFAQFAHAAPVRALVLGRMLREVVLRLPWPRPKWPYFRALDRRLEYIRQRIEPLAFQRLVAHAADPPSEANEAAIRLLVTLGEGARLKAIPNLTLCLSHESLGEHHVKCLAGGSYAHVDLSMTGNLSHFEFLRGNDSVKTLDVSGCDRGQAALWLVPTLPALERLSMRGTDVYDSDLCRYLSQAKNLKFLDLTWTKVTSRGVNELRQTLPDLEIQF
jgi:hypothetical protein